MFGDQNSFLKMIISVEVIFNLSIMLSKGFTVNQTWVELGLIIGFLWVCIKLWQSFMWSFSLIINTFKWTLINVGLRIIYTIFLVSNNCIFEYIKLWCYLMLFQPQDQYLNNQYITIIEIFVQL